MFNALLRFGIVISFILVVGIVPTEGQQESPQAQRYFYGLIQNGELAPDMNQWDSDARNEYLGYLPSEYRERFFQAYSKLHEAKCNYWETRVELFEVLHPVLSTLFKKEIEETYKQSEQVLSNVRHSYRDSLAEQGIVQGIIKEHEQKVECQKNILTGNYRAATESPIREDAKYLLHSTLNEFGFYSNYSEFFDPDKQSEYRNTLIEEIIMRYDKKTEMLRAMAEEQKIMTEEYRQRVGKETFIREDFPFNFIYFASQGHGFSDPFPFNDEHKQRLVKDEPVYYSLGLNSLHFTYNEPRSAVQEYLKEIRDAEREPWKIDATPELSKLAINQEAISRWDGSLSLQPFMYAIAERCVEIDMASLQMNIHQTSMHLKMGAQAFPFGIEKLPNQIFSNTHPGLMALIRGEKDVVFSTRHLSQTEIAEAKRLKVELVSIPFAKDAFVFIQNRHNPVRNLTTEQYQGIFSGKYTTWKEVGGFGGEIKPFVRNVNSGSEELMQTLVMRNIPVHEKFKPKMVDSMGMIFELLENTPSGIAYSIYHFDRYMMFNPSTRVMAVDGILPSTETITSGKYPLVYEAVLVYRKNPGEKVDKFVRWLLSDEGQKLVRSVGYVPIRAL